MKDRTPSLFYDFQVQILFVEIAGVFGLWLSISSISAMEFLVYLFQVLLILLFGGKVIKDPDLPDSGDGDNLPSLTKDTT